VNGSILCKYQPDALNMTEPTKSGILQVGKDALNFKRRFQDVYF
jgi:hypothetical protein